MRRTIETEADIAEGMAALASVCPTMRMVGAAVGQPPLRRRSAGFEGLAGIIVAQQLSVASASAIWTKVERVFPERTPEAFLSASDATLRSAGLSGPKIRTLRAIAAAVHTDILPIDRLDALDADEAAALLTSVKGIGPWTADIYLMFGLGHADAFAAGDLALQEALKIAESLAERPDQKALLQRAEAWRPWRAVAARALWSYYRVIKARDGVVGLA